MNKQKLVRMLLGGVIVAIVCSVIWWNMKREFNYSIGYEGKVEDTVREMVRPECLKQEYR